MGHNRKFNRNRQRRVRRTASQPSRPLEWSLPALHDSPYGSADEIGSRPGPSLLASMVDYLEEPLTNVDPVMFICVISSIIGAFTNVPTPPLRALIDDVSDVRTTKVHALLIGLAAMAPEAGDRACATELLVARADDNLDELPEWIHDLAHATPTLAAFHYDLWWDFSFSVIELQVGKQNVCVIADIGHVRDYAVTKAHLFPGRLQDFLDQVGDFSDDPILPGVETEYVELGRAGARMVAAVAAADRIDVDDHMNDTNWRPMRAEMLWAARLAAQADPFAVPEHDGIGIDPLFDPDSTPATSAEVVELVAAFWSSSFASHLSVLDVDLDALNAVIVDYSLNQGHCRLESWGPQRVASFLLDYVFAEVWIDDEQLKTLPDLLRAWIDFLNERCAMPASMGQETVDRIREATPLFVAFLRARTHTMQAMANDVISAHL